MQRPLAAVAAGAVLLSLAACGGDDDTSTGGASPDSEVRTVEIHMVDIAFEPDTLEVNRGQTIRFRFTNRGEVAHDAFIGDRDAQVDHENDMRESDDNKGHDGGHGDEERDAVTVEPGRTGELTYTFDDMATLEIGCHQPGHYDAGMKITVEVA